MCEDLPENELFEEVRQKEERIQSYLIKNNLYGMVIGRQDNFAWITGGGENKVILSSELGFSYLLITREKKMCISLVADYSRVMDEVLTQLGYEGIELMWYKKSKEEKISELIFGKRVISDFPIAGADFKLKDIYDLHYPLTEQEIKKYSILGKKTEEIITKISLDMEPGMSEYEIEAKLFFEYTKNNISPSVLLVASDERIIKYRHPIPSKKRVEKYVMISPAVRKWGLHANVCRLIYFGEPPSELLNKYRAASIIAAHVLSMCKEGALFKHILKEEIRLYKVLGYEHEWKNHFQGGITGYMVSDPTLCFDDTARVRINQAFEWFITISGVKVSELSVCTNKGRDVLSVNGLWPTEEYSANGEVYRFPEILIR